jgi:TetR/AcrR family transcriptional repressor of nem operon
MPPPTLTPTAHRLLDAAEQRTRKLGFNGFSFRDLADDVGIRSASVHHHFPTKADLGRGLVQRYRARVFESLGAPEDGPLADAITKVVEAHRYTLLTLDGLCICGMLGAEGASLPPEVAVETRGFFDALTRWIATALGTHGATPEAAEAGALTLVAAINGAMILARSLGDPTVYDRVVQPVAARLVNSP